MNVHYIPVHTQPHFRQFGFKDGDFPETERYYREAISLPMFPSMADESVDYVIRQLSLILER